MAEVPAETSIEWAVRYSTGDLDGFQICADLDSALRWQRTFRLPSEIVCRVVTRSAWEVAKPVSW